MTAGHLVSLLICGFLGAFTSTMWKRFYIDRSPRNLELALYVTSLLVMGWCSYFISLAKR